MIYSDGREYEGKWFMDMQSGIGTMNYPNGDVYEGNWFQNQRHAQGKMVYADKNLVYEGEWMHDNIAGEGELTITNPFSKEVALKERFLNGCKIIRKVGER